ncbi:hypothetical protein G5C60_36395 [Streptomyces sp. HC44]|uniref:Uncharacterized protein n=1 Tax=Streptomyces scabichelini TaxID=2711217 RepID=A0A6G4VGJ9_9ACTN|nr:hypothetical protein [Streptomyces scabichelini]NGO12934.1 hypothetical protein [Streptomyces scabichelini]
MRSEPGTRESLSSKARPVRRRPQRSRTDPGEGTTAQLVTTERRRILRLAKHWPWTDVITEAPARLQVLPSPG